MKLSQNRKGRNFFAAPFCWNPFLQLAAGEKVSKNSAATKKFGPSYLELTLVENGRITMT